MKIEIAESLLASWLKHVKGCKIVQTNWKPSPYWLSDPQDSVSTLIDMMQARFPNVFKQNKPQQLIAQAEIDALGIDCDNAEPYFYMVDTAFHSNGLGYGNAAENADIITKKMLRSALILFKYFYTTSGTIIFASPKMNKKSLSLLQTRIQEMEQFVKDLGFWYKFELITGTDFANLVKIMAERSTKIDDTNELFLRAYQLCTTCHQAPETQS